MGPQDSATGDTPMKVPLLVKKDPASAGLGARPNAWVCGIAEQKPGTGPGSVMVGPGVAQCTLLGSGTLYSYTTSALAGAVS